MSTVTSPIKPSLIQALEQLDTEDRILFKKNIYNVSRRTTNTSEEKTKAILDVAKNLLKQFDTRGERVSTRRSAHDQPQELPRPFEQTPKPTEEPLTFQSLIERLIAMQIDSNLRGRKINQLLLAFNRVHWMDSVHQQADSARSLLPIAFKAVAVTTGVLQTAFLACPVDTLQSCIPQFLQDKAGEASKLTEYLVNLVKPGQDASNFAASWVESHNSGFRTEENMRGEFFHETMRHSMEKQGSLDSEFAKDLQTYQTLLDALRASAQSLIRLSQSR